MKVYEHESKMFGATMYPQWKLADITAYLDNFDVRCINDYYSLWDTDELVAYFKVVGNKTLSTVDNIYISVKFRGQKLFSKFLLFLRTRENIQKLQIGNVHSTDTYELLKHGGLKLFTKYWINNYGERKDFNTDTIDDFYGAGKWKLTLENNSDFSDFPRFNGAGYIKESYDGLIGIFNLNSDF